MKNPQANSEVVRVGSVRAGKSTKINQGRMMQLNLPTRKMHKDSKVVDPVGDVAFSIWLDALTKAIKEKSKNER